MGVRGWVSLLLLGAGVIALALAVATGGASFFLVLFVPVLAGSSALLVLGAVLVMAGFFVPFVLLPIRDDEKPVSAAGPANDGPVSGGLVLLGPVPIFFGSWTSPRRWVYVAAAAAGTALLLAGLALYFALRG